MSPSAYVHPQVQHFADLYDKFDQLDLSKDVEIKQPDMTGGAATRSADMRSPSGMQGQRSEGGGGQGMREVANMPAASPLPESHIDDWTAYIKLLDAK